MKHTPDKEAPFGYQVSIRLCPVCAASPVWTMNLAWNKSHAKLIVDNAKKKCPWDKVKVEPYKEGNVPPRR